MRLALLTAPAVEPVTLDEAKAHLRVDWTDEDALIASLIRAARQHAERLTGRAIITQQWRANFDAFPCDDALRLPKAPLQSVGSVTYLDYADTQQTLSTDVYAVDTDGLIGRLTLKSLQYWPATSILRNAVTVNFTAGYGDAATDVPDDLRAALLLLVGHWYANRESVVTGTSATELPASARALLDAVALVGGGCD